MTDSADNRDPRMKIVIDWERCIGAGMCTGIAPHLFELQDGKLVVIEEEPSEDQRAAVEAAVACCPVEAISIS